MYVVWYLNAWCSEKEWKKKPCKTLRQAKWWETHLKKEQYKAYYALEEK